MDIAVASAPFMNEGNDEFQHQVEPHDHDVLCGRGGDINIHPGNIKFRKLVSTNKIVYLTSRFKREKRLIAEKIVNAIKNQNPPGRFLTKDKANGYWFEISDEKARDKTSQALREGAPKIREQIHNEMERNVSPKISPSDWSSRDHDSYIDVYEVRDYPHRYDSRNPQLRNDDRYYNRHNIINTFRDRFGCPTNINDVRDDIYAQDIDYDYPQEYEDQYDHSYDYQHTNVRGSPYHESKWNQHTYQLPPNQVDSRNQTQSDFNQYSESHCNDFTNATDDPRQNYINKASDTTLPQSRMPGMWQSLKSMLSWGSDCDLDDRQKSAGTTQMESCEYEMGTQHDEFFLNEPKDEVPKHWTSSFHACYAFNPFQACESNFMDIANWRICGEHPESNITSIQSIEIDEPTPSSEMRGSSLVHVFDECSQTTDAPKYDESALHDSSVNLCDIPSIDINFSSDKDHSLNIKFSKSDMSL